LLAYEGGRKFDEALFVTDRQQGELFHRGLFCAGAF